MSLGFTYPRYQAAELQHQGAQIFASVPLVFEENRGQTDPQATGQGLAASSNYFRRA